MAAGDYQGTYAAEKVIVIVGGVIVSGFTDGDFVTAQYDEDRYFKKVGADGEVGRSKNASKSGTIEITLSGTSGANDLLNGLFALNSLSGIDSPIPVAVTDLSGRTLIAATKAWLKTAPPVTLGTEINDRVWTLDAADLLMTVGGNG